MIEALLVCTSLLVIDGDTLECDGRRLRLIGDGRPHISGFDAPERGNRAKCAKEARLADKAQYVARFIVRGAKEGGTLEIVDTGEVDRFGRTLARVVVGEETLGEILLRRGLAKDWQPGQKPDWCE